MEEGLPCPINGVVVKNVSEPMDGYEIVSLSDELNIYFTSEAKDRTPVTRMEVGIERPCLDFGLQSGIETRNNSIYRNSDFGYM